MTQSEFTAFYPQFAGFTPAIVLSTYIAQANARFETFSPEDAEEARRLYAAHRLTMYARVALPDGTTPSKAAIAAAGQAQQKIASKKVGEVSVTYATGASSSSVSASSTPSRMSSPRPILLYSTPPMLTLARLTRCITARMCLFRF